MQRKHQKIQISKKSESVSMSFGRQVHHPAWHKNVIERFNLTKFDIFRIPIV